MKIPVLPAAVLLSLLVLHSAQGATLGSPEEEGTIDNYASRPEAFKTDDFFNWHALFESIKRKLPFLNWEAFPKLKGLRSVTPDAQ
ncbi:keratinocyte differentiation-associated protein isoform X2 [Cebus imitator]|uniref:Keratinocyte differentiation associated protein n=2 Tax=Cebinae TaxID=38070 RepID=A0A2K5Q3Z0_CEBIM|nr:keratinocyte differentiation-associated protein isoform X2 [Cebus imitator]XP_032104911.1 keratinocyte differentiation-associated protein isoform X2 [Sapajus apella]XP_039322439.1 keratinocyte differentiation-associated protein isoform X2 [Saimiri boliviensis boliviensis]